MEELDWDLACLRIEEYLHAHAVEPRERVLALTLGIFQEAKTLHAQNPSSTPPECAMALAIRKSDDWFSSLAGDPAKVSHARIAFFASGRNDLFLEPALPADFVFAIRNAGIEAGPDLKFQSLLRKEFDYGTMADIARETWDQFSWGHTLRAFALWVVVFLAAWGAYLRFFQ
jgi:hypothetical protein